MADESVHCVVTSPPYWGLRDYGVPPSVWGGDPRCRHDFAVEIVSAELRLGGGLAAFSKRHYRGGAHKAAKVPSINAERGFCRHCGAWRGVFGLEPIWQLYIAHAVEVFREVRRVLRPDGTLWLNMGDSYAASRSYQVSDNKNPRVGPTRHLGRAVVAPGLKPKDLCGMPWRLAFALQDDGWYLRQDVIWHKPNPMPESVRDRCTKAHEYVFLLTKSARYCFDAEAIKEQAGDGPGPGVGGWAVQGEHSAIAHNVADRLGRDA